MSLTWTRLCAEDGAQKEASSQGHQSFHHATSRPSQQARKADRMLPSKQNDNFNICGVLNMRSLPISRASSLPPRSHAFSRLNQPARQSAFCPRRAAPPRSHGSCQRPQEHWQFQTWWSAHHEDEATYRLARSPTLPPRSHVYSRPNQQARQPARCP